MITPPAISYELADKQQAIAAGGIGAMLQLTKQLDLRGEINRAIKLFKMHLPYDEADHVLNISLNLLAGGNCLDHLEDRRQDEAYLNAVGAHRIPDPTTAGDFCRRFNDRHVLSLMSAFNRVREKVWKKQPTHGVTNTQRNVKSRQKAKSVDVSRCERLGERSAIRESAVAEI